MAGLGITAITFITVSIMCSPFAFWAYEAWNQMKGMERAEYFASRK